MTDERKVVNKQISQLYQLYYVYHFSISSQPHARVCQAPSLGSQVFQGNVTRLYVAGSCSGYVSNTQPHQSIFATYRGVYKLKSSPPQETQSYNTLTYIKQPFKRKPLSTITTKSQQAAEKQTSSRANMPFLSNETPSSSNITLNPVTDSEIPSSTASQSSSSAPGHASSTAHIRTEAEEAADRLYEERIEEEYAKREGGA